MRAGFGFGAGVAFALAGWANRPVLAQAHPQTLVAVIVTAILCAYYGGRKRGLAGRGVSATAVAKSEATATAAVVVNVDSGLRARSLQNFGGLDTAPWIVGQRAHELDEAHEGMDLDELDCDPDELLELDAGEAGASEAAGVPAPVQAPTYTGPSSPPDPLRAG